MVKVVHGVDKIVRLDPPEYFGYQCLCGEVFPRVHDHLIHMGILYSIDQIYKVLDGQDYWKYVLPRFINYDWREELKQWRNPT